MLVKRLGMTWRFCSFVVDCIIYLITYWKRNTKKSVTQKPWNHQTGFKDIRRTSSLILPGHKYPHTWQSTKNLEAKAKEDGILLKRLKWQNAIYTYIFLVDWPQRHLR